MGRKENSFLIAKKPFRMFGNQFLLAKMDFQVFGNQFLLTKTPFQVFEYRFLPHKKGFEKTFPVFLLMIETSSLIIYNIHAREAIRRFRTGSPQPLATPRPWEESP